MAAKYIYLKRLGRDNLYTRVHPIVVDILHYEHITQLPMLGLINFKYERDGLLYEQKQPFLLQAYNMYYHTQAFWRFINHFRHHDACKRNTACQGKTFYNNTLFLEQSSWWQKTRIVLQNHRLTCSWGA